LDSATSVATIKGFLNALNIEGEMDVFHVLGYDSNIEKAQAQYLVSISDDSLNVQVNTKAYILNTGPIDWDTASVDFNYTNEYMTIATDFRRDDHLNTQIDSRFSIGDTMSIDISKFKVKTAFANFYMPDSMKAHIYNYEKLEVENFRILDQNHKDFIIDINGNFSNYDSNKFQVLVQHFNLSQLNQLIGKPDLLDGYFNTNIALSGSASNPLIDGHIHLKNPEFDQYAFTSVESNFGYANGKGFAELTIPEMGNSFLANISAPFKAHFDSLQFVFDLPKEFEGSLFIDSLNIAKTVKTFMPHDSIHGILNGKIKTSGDLFAPLFYGNMNLSDGKYINKNLGIEYNDIVASLDFNGNKMSFDTVLVRQKDGFISVVGEIEFDSTIVKGDITNSSLQINAKQFFLAKHRNYEMLIDANTFITSKNQEPEFGGKIKVIRSDLFLPALMSDSKTDIENNIPLLVEAIQSSPDSIAAKKIVKATSDKENKNGLSDQLKGKLNVEIPRNTWIRSNDIRMELSGELEIVKTGPYFELFGNIDVLRGYYILYGRKLNVTESQIIFQGGEELDPTLQIEAEYIYRGTDKQKRYLNLSISGKMSEPEIAFTLDGTEITETDGVSVLIFGATSDEIGYSGQNGLIGSMSSNAVASMVSSQLSKTIGSQFKLDMIEITSTENWQSASFVVGKYLTNNIFVIYERGFGETDGDEITPETITVEYEINDKLFLRLQSGSSEDSGVDVILKFEQETEKKRPVMKKK
jgi:autotransporter translocation and assembly factor TamB